MYKKYLYILLGIIIAIPTIAWGVNISVPQATSFGQLLRGNANGTYTPVATSTLGIPGNPDFTYNTDIGFGVTGSATGTKTHFTAGIHASGTSQFDNATSTMQTIKDALWLQFHTSALALTDANGKIGEYTGTTCTNQFTRALSALGVATCETVDISADTNLAVTYPMILTNDTLSTALSTTTLKQTYGTNQGGELSFATSSDTNLGLNITNTNGAFTFTPTWIGTLANARLTNSTISGIALGNSLENLTATDSTLTFSGAYNGGTARTIGLNLGNANTWTAKQDLFGTASSTLFSANTGYFGETATTTINSTGILIPAGSSAAPSFSFSNDSNMGIYRGSTGEIRMTDNTADLAHFDVGQGIKTLAGNAIGPSFSFISDANTGVFNVSPDILGFSTGGVERGRFNAAGNLGIGTTSPYAKLSVVGQTVAEYFTATSTTATSTFANAVGVGTTTASQVYAMFTAKAKSTALDVAHFFNSVGTKILALTEAGATALGAWDFGGADSLEIPNGSAPTVDATGECAWDTTSGQFLCYDGTAVNVFTQSRYLGLSSATTTTWSGTTTGQYINTVVVPFAGTIKTAVCTTDAGTLNVDIYHTSTHLALFNASTTANTITFTSNNTVTANEKLYMAAGTPASTPTLVSCTLALTVTRD